MKFENKLLNLGSTQLIVAVRLSPFHPELVEGGAVRSGHASNKLSTNG